MTDVARDAAKSMRRAIALLALTALTFTFGCHDPQPNRDGTNVKNQPISTSNFQVELRRDENAKKLDSDPCLRRVPGGWKHIGWKNCLEFLPPAKMKGIWIQDFEESSFLPGGGEIPKPDNRDRFTIFLDIDAAAVSKITGTPLDMTRARAVELNFVGRQSKYPGPYYTGTNDQVVVVDRIISARYLGVVPDPDWLPQKR